MQEHDAGKALTSDGYEYDAPLTCKRRYRLQGLGAAVREGRSCLVLAETNMEGVFPRYQLTPSNLS